MSLRALVQRIERLGSALRAAHDHRLADLGRGILLPIAIGIACVCFGITVNKHFAIRDWMFLRYAKAWLLALYWFSGCMSAGYAVVRHLGRRMRFSEQLVASAATGVYLSYLLMFLGGVLGLYRMAAFPVLLPAAMLASGARPALGVGRRAWRHLLAARRLAPPRVSPLGAAVWAFGTFCLGMMYLNILTPDNASFDTIYYHLGIAQQFKANGGIYPSPEGWLVEALPLLASTIYTLAFIFPTNDLFDAMMGAAHIEFLLFVATLACLPVLVRWLVPRAWSPAAWVAMFLFPAILVYDAGLHTANDHVAAFWAVPIWMALRRSWERLEPRSMALFSISAAGALLTKYQAACLVLAPVLALTVRALVLAVRRTGAPWARGMGVALGVGFLATAPHWLKNWVWYGDPLFPALHQYLALHPWHPHATEAVDWNLQRQMQRPHGTAWEQLRQIWRGAFEFPFRTRERRDFHGTWPIFGPLFTLSLAWLPFLRRTRRLWLMLIVTQLGLFFWFFFSAFERYIQPLVPWMAAVVAGCVLLIWQRRWPAKVAMLAMLGLALVWGGDAYFFPHLLLGDSPIRATAEYLSTGFRGDLARRERFLYPYKNIGEALPADARLLLHEHFPRLGLQRPIVTDYPGFQTLISYEDLGSSRAVYELYRSLGITHIVHERGFAARVDTLGGDLRFWEFAANRTLNPKHYGFITVTEMPKTAPEQELADEVAYLGCDPAYSPGLYSLASLDTRQDDGRRVAPRVPAPKDRRKLRQFVANAGYLVSSSSCKGKRWPIPPNVHAGFKKVAGRGTEDLFIRQLPPTPDPIAPP